MIKMGYTSIKKLCAKVRYFIENMASIGDSMAAKQIK
jgi:hypothetical protein